MVDIASWVYYYCLDTAVLFSITPRFFHGVPSTVRDDYSKSINIVSTLGSKRNLSKLKMRKEERENCKMGLRSICL